MKTTISITSLALIILTSVSVFAQKDKEAMNAYRRSLKDFKKEKYVSGVTYGLRALGGELKEKHRSKQILAFKEGFQTFYGNKITSTSSLKSQVSEYLGEVSIGYSQSLIDAYSSLKGVIDMIKETDPAVTKSLNLDQSILIDYQPEISSAKELYETHKTTFVAQEYDKGLESLEIGTKRDSYIAFKKFSNVRKYEANYKDVILKYAEAKVLATYRLGIKTITNKIKGYEKYEFASTARNQLSSSLGTRVTKNEFLEMNYDNPEITISGSLNSYEYKIDEIIADSKELTKKVVVSEQEVKNSEGKIEKVKTYEEVKGTFTTYKQYYDATVYGNLTVYNTLQSDEILSQELTGYSRQTLIWYSFSGDDQVLSKSQKSNLKDEKPEIPSKTDLISDACINYASRASNITYNQLSKLFE